MKLENKTYDILKQIALILLPLSAFITSLGEIWNIPYMNYVSLTIVALDTFLGAILHSSSKMYWGTTKTVEVFDPKDEGVD